MSRSVKTMSCVAVSLSLASAPGALAGGGWSPLDGIEVTLYQVSNTDQMQWSSFDNSSFDSTYGVWNYTGDQDTQGTFAGGDEKSIRALFAQDPNVSDPLANVFSFSNSNQQGYESGTRLSGNFILSFTKAQTFQLVSNFNSNIEAITLSQSSTGTEFDLTTLAAGTEFEVGSYSLYLDFEVDTDDRNNFGGGVNFEAMESSPVVPGAGIGLAMLAGVRGLRRRRDR